jgi:hypothetical protein
MSYNNGLFPALNPAATANTLHQSSNKNINSPPRPKIFQYIDENIIGKDYVLSGPWGSRRCKVFFIFIAYLIISF